MEELLKKISVLIAEGETEEALEAVEKALEKGLDPLIILNQGAAQGLNIVSDLYSKGEAFLPELMLSGDAMSEVIKLIFSKMDASEVTSTRAGIVVIGQAKGDVHDIGKNIVIALLAVNGFEVHDLGTDVSVKTFLEKAKEVNANIIGISTLLTTSLPFLQDALNYITDTGNRNKYNYVVGGGPVTSEFAVKLGVDGWSRSAVDAVQMCKELIKLNNPGKIETVIVDSEK